MTPALSPIEMLLLRKNHANRLANTDGASGEGRSLAITENWKARPTGQAMRNLLAALAKQGVVIAATSFDLLEIPVDAALDFDDPISIERWLPHMIFIEVKTASQKRVQPDFGGFFFALTEKEIQASEVLGDRHCVVLFNAETEQMLRTSVAAILRKAKSTTWQVSVQL